MSRWLAIAAVVAGCGDDNGGPLFEPNPECAGDPIVAFSGTQPQLINSIAIALEEEGFDLDGDGAPDNKFAAIGPTTMVGIRDAFRRYDIVIPIEMFDLDSATNDDCVKLALYRGVYASDNDDDGARPSRPSGDCNDHDPAIHPEATEIAGNLKDDDCDGLADEDGDAPTTNGVDGDGDGVSPMAGDCDDTNMAVHVGAAELCGDGLDNDCDGVADRSEDDDGVAVACSPFDPKNPVTIPIDPSSFTDGRPTNTFVDGKITKRGDRFVLAAGPTSISLQLPLGTDVTFDLRLTGATLESELVDTGGVITLSNGRLGGVVEASTADTIRGARVSVIGLEPENSLLDAAFASVLGPVIGLPKAPGEISNKYTGCRTPDIDVDGDGLEAFCDSDPDTDPKTVDICIDGDGTEIRDELDDAGNVTMHCSQAMDGDKPRFVDGISIALKLTTTPIQAIVWP
ncbi:MAG: putative metal-binding motif-containing protein [Kofleriaceae bacterium]